MTLMGILGLAKHEDEQTTIDINDVVSFSIAGRTVSGRIWGFLFASDGRVGVRVRVENDRAWFVRNYVIDIREVVSVEYALTAAA